MASQGPNNPGTLVNDDSIGSSAWVNPTNAASSNNSYATCNEGNESNYLRATNFGFSIPAGATIDGIIVEVEKRNSSNNVLVSDNIARLSKTSGYVGDNLAAGEWPTSDTYVSYGGASNLWGTTWSVAEINSSDFGYAISMTPNFEGPPTTDINVDHIRITVYYTEAASSSSSSNSSSSFSSSSSSSSNSTSLSSSSSSDSSSSFSSSSSSDSSSSSSSSNSTSSSSSSDSSSSFSSLSSSDSSSSSSNSSSSFSSNSSSNSSESLSSSSSFQQFLLLDYLKDIVCEVEEWAECCIGRLNFNTIKMWPSICVFGGPANNELIGGDTEYDYQIAIQFGIEDKSLDGLVNQEKSDLTCQKIIDKIDSDMIINRKMGVQITNILVEYKPVQNTQFCIQTIVYSFKWRRRNRI